MKLSILDQAPISSHQSAKEALEASMKLAQSGESFGYTRFWMAEHHDLRGLACPAPEVMLSYIGSQTSHIRIGSGAVLLPHYKPYKVAEMYNMLAVLFPGRIDVGIGRAPGGSAEATNALSDNFLQQVWKLPDLIEELLTFLDDDYTTGNEHVTLSASPVPEVAPTPWLLGTSKKSALLAAEKGMSYTFGQFMSDSDGVEIIKQYVKHFKPRKEGDKPYVILTLSVICAETTAKAEELALSNLMWSLQKTNGEGNGFVPSVEEAKQCVLDEKDYQAIEKIKKDMVIGNPHEVKGKLIELQEKYRADEIMIVTITHSPEDKIKSYRLLAEAFNLFHP
jgi:luciferase family oxidoreductase group 1